MTITPVPRDLVHRHGAQTSIQAKYHTHKIIRSQNRIKMQKQAPMFLAGVILCLVEFHKLLAVRGIMVNSCGNVFSFSVYLPDNKRLKHN